MNKKKVVILGAGFAGLQAARRLKRAPVEVVLVDRTNHHLFQPLLYQVATGGLNPSEIASPVRSVLRRQKNLTILMGTVTGVDYEAHTVELDHGESSLDYDYLIMAMGGRTSYFGNDHWECHAPGLKTLKDALRIRQEVLYAFEQAEKSNDERDRERLMTVVVVGGGPTGVELAGAMAELRRYVLRWDFKNIDAGKAKVYLVEGSDRLLGAFPERLSRYAAKRLERMGVELLFGERVESLEEGKVVTSERTIEAENVIWAAGVGGHEMAETLGDDRDRAGRLMVDEYLRLGGRDEVYCVGDMAHYEHEHTFSGKALPGVAPVANQQGKAAADNIVAHLKGKELKKFSYFDKGSMATIGRSAAVVAAPPPVNIQMTGLLAWLAWLFIHLIYIVDYKNRLFVLLRWTWKYFAWKWTVRLISKPERAQEPEPEAQPLQAGSEAEESDGDSGELVGAGEESD